MSEVKKIFWAIEPSEANKELDARLSEFLQKLDSSVKIEVYPICVMGSRYAQMGQYFESYDNSPLRENLIADCQSYLSRFSNLPLKDLVLLDNYHTAQSAEVMLFADYVDKENPDFVVIGSHGRGGWERAFLGSFTESFLLRTRCPVFVIGPQCQSVGDLEKAFMPVEISESSGRFIEHFMDNHLLSFVKKLELFHKISLVDYEDIAWAPTFYGVADYSNQDVLNQAKKASEEFLSAYMNHPLSQKRLSYTISDSIDSISDSIVDGANKERVGLLIMRSQAGEWSARLLGSVTKGVIRAAEVPVLVYPCHYREEGSL